MVAPERDSQAVQVEKLLELAEKIQADIDSLERVRSQRSARVSVLIGGLAGVLYFLIRYSFSSNLASRDHIEISSLTAALAITVALAVQNLGKLVLRSGGRRPQIPLF